MAEPPSSKLGKQKLDGVDEEKSGGKKTAKQTPRKRVSQACDTCRSRKDRCDGERPSCSTCIQNGRECSYNANVKKRGLPEGYVRGMEKLWGLAVKEIEDVEDELLAALGDQEQQRAVWNDENNAENLVELWRKSQIFSGLERLLSSMTLDTPESVKRKRANSTTQASKKGGAREMQSAFTPNNNPENNWTGTGFEENLNMRQQAMTAPSPAQITTSQPESILSPTNVHRNTPAMVNPVASHIPELPSETWHLLDVYFSYTHSWLPIIEKHDLLRISYHYSQHQNSSGSSRSGDHAVLWAAIAYAKFQHRAINNIPRALGSVGEMVWTAERMYIEARQFIPDEEGPYELGHVQALLILTLANMGTDHLDRAWLLVGQAVRIAIDLQLDQPLEHILTASKSKSRAKHVFLGCFVLDTLVAARLGRRPHLRSAEVDLVGLLEEDGLEEWDPWTDCLNVRKVNTTSSRVPAAILSTFNNLVKVLRILNEASCSTATESTVIQFSERLLEQLQAWAQTQPVPSHFETDPTQSASAMSLLPHQYHLHAAYSTALSFSQLLSHNDNNNVFGSASRFVWKTTDILGQYSNNFGLLIAPPTFEYYIKTAYDVLDTTHNSMDDTQLKMNDWRRNLDYCLETIEPAWPVFETFRASVAGRSGLRRRESQVAYDLISGSNHSAESPHPGKTPQSMHSYGTLSHPSPRSTSQSGQPPQLPTYTSAPSQRTSSFGQASSHGLPQNPLNIYENAHATFGMGNSQVASTREAQFTAAAQVMARANPQYQTRLRSSVSMSDTDVTGEPVFGDLMRLDATEWTGNWDQSLVNLGFTDQDNMNQAFYTFCQEPDPLQPNNVFQQLLATSNAEAANFFDNAAFGGMNPNLGISMPGFDGFGFGDENEGIEAGQILQALAAGEQQPTARMS